MKQFPFHFRRLLVILAVAVGLFTMISGPRLTRAYEDSQRIRERGGEKPKVVDPSKLAVEVRNKFFGIYCKQCHHGAEPKSDVADFDVLDYKSLTKKRGDVGSEWYYVKPGVRGAEALEKSHLWNRAGVKGVAGADGDMPLESAKQPSEKLRTEILRKWIEAGAPPWPTDRVSADSSAGLWYKVQKIFDGRCMKCHKKGGSAYIEDFHLDDRDSLIKERLKQKPKLKWDQSPWHYVKPGAPDASLLYYAIKTDKMPRTAKKLSDQEKKVVRDWIEQGAPGPPPTEKRPYLTHESQLKAILNHLSKTSEKERPFQRYFTFTHLHNDVRVTSQELSLLRSALSKLVNSLSWNPNMVIPQPIPGANDSIFVINFSELGWSRPGVWEEIAKSYPYGLKFPEVSDQIAKLSGTPLPYVRADWFIANASRPPLYHLLLELPKTSDDLEKRLGINFIQNFLQGKLVRAGYLGASTTTSGNRVVERQEIKKYYKGAYWKSYDFGRGPKGSLRDDPRIYPLGPNFPNHPYPQKAFQHDGNEIIFSLPNGLQGYMIVDRKGQRMDAAPAWILKDQNEFSGTPNIVNGISCIACHQNGMQTVRDQVSLNIGKFAPFSRRYVEALYVDRQTMSELLKKDQNRFEDAVKVAIDPFLTPESRRDAREPIYAMSKRYNSGLDLASVAWELNFDDPEKLKTILKNLPNIWKDLYIRGPLVGGVEIRRKQWEAMFSQAAERLGRGKALKVSSDNP